MFLGGRIIGGYSCFIVRAFKFFDNIFFDFVINEIYRERTGKFER